MLSGVEALPWKYQPMIFVSTHSLDYLAFQTLSSNLLTCLLAWFWTRPPKNLFNYQSQMFIQVSTSKHFFHFLTEHESAMFRLYLIMPKLTWVRYTRTRRLWAASDGDSLLVTLLRWRMCYKPLGRVWVSYLLVKEREPGKGRRRRPLMVMFSHIYIKLISYSIKSLNLLHCPRDEAKIIWVLNLLHFIIVFALLFSE